MFWYLIAAAVATTLVALILVAVIQKKRLQKTLRLDIINHGNVPTRYLLRAEDADGSLAFRFTAEGDRLQSGYTAEALVSRQDAPAPRASLSQPSTDPIEAPPAARAGCGLGKAAGTAMSLTGIVADLLGTLGHLLPGSVAAPLLRTAGELRRAQAKASYAQGLSSSMGRIKGAPIRVPAAVPAPPAPSRLVGPSAEGGVPAHMFDWVQTPAVQPGQTLIVELHLRSIAPRHSPERTFQVISRCAEDATVPAVSETGTVRLAAGFWGHRFLPYLLVLALATMALALILGLAVAGVLMA